MFTSQSSSWRSPQIERVKGSTTNNNKPILFEDAANYILTSQSTARELINELMGITPTHCLVFYPLSVDNGYLFYTNITQEITYLLIICYLKYTYTTRLNTAHLIEPNKIKEWLIILGFEKIVDKLKDKYLKQIKINKESISFANNCYAPIKLSKLISINNDTSVKHTNKLQKLGLKDLLYYNHDNRCLGATNYWLEQIAKSYTYPTDRKNIKKTYIASLKIANVELNKKTVIFIRNEKTKDYINQLQNGVYINDQFKHIQDIYTLNSNLHLAIAKLFTLMQKNNLSQLYIQIITDNHAMGMAIIGKGNFTKILAYDPNDKESYIRMTITDLKTNYSDFFSNMPYFKKNTTKDIILLLRCQAYVVGSTQLQKMDDEILEIPDNNQDEVLNLAIVSNNEKLVLQLANKNSNPYNLIVAVQFNHVNIVKILIECIPSSLNYIDENGGTALYYAKALNNIKIIKLLQRKLDIPPIKNIQLNPSIHIRSN